jgi:hypothetical protein
VTVARLVEIVALNACFLLVALAIGDVVLGVTERLVRRFAPASPDIDRASVTRLGAALLVGFGVESYIGVALGLAHVFYKATLIAAGLVVVVLCRRSLARWWRWLKSVAVSARLRDAPLLSFLGLLAVGVFAVYYALALTPPIAADALAYHLPEAQLIVTTHHLPLNLGGHWHYGNLPKLAEVLWAEGIAFGPYSVSQVLHMSIAGAFVLFAFGMVRSLWGSTSAVLAALFIVSYNSFIQYASTPYIDAAVTGFDVAGLLCVVRWADQRRMEDLGRGALLLGLGLAAKYSPGPTVVFAGVLVVVTLLRRFDRRRAFQILGVLGALLFAACGFWYVKNLVRLGNPTYPLYFGHRGVTDAQYNSALASIQMFGPRTLGQFVRVPTRFEGLLTAPEFFAFFVLPLGLLIRRSRTAARLLVLYFVLYVPYWFFLATHQVRFLAPALIGGVVILAAVAAVVLEWLPRAGRALAVSLALALTVVAGTRVSGLRQQLGIPVSTGQYLVGRAGQDRFLADNLGCQFAVLGYLRDRGRQGNLVDNWTVWHDTSPSFYARRNRFIEFGGEADDPSIWSGLQRQDLRYLYFKPATKSRFFSDTDPQVVAYRQQHQGVEDTLLQHSRKIWSSGGCDLYQIVPPTRPSLAAVPR